MNENFHKLTILQKRRLRCKRSYLSYTADVEKFGIADNYFMYNYELCRYKLGLTSNDDALTRLARLKENIGVYRTPTPEP